MLINAIEKADTIAISGHTRPDGDCVGSCMGLYLYIKKNYPEKEVAVYLDEIPEPFRFVKCSDEIRHEIPEDKIYDLFILSDCGDPERLGFSGPLCRKAKRTFCVDHHISNQAWADENYVYPDASSASELVYDLLDYDKIDKDVAECLYTGMVHDTGVFRHSCTHPSTLRAAASLMEKGIDFTAIITKTFDEKSYAQNQILGRALLESFCVFDGRVIFSSIDQKTMTFYQVDSKQLDGIVNQLKLTKGVDVAVFMYEVEPLVYKVSLRSTEAVDVSKLASGFGGGGHMRAAGFTMAGTTYDIINNLTRRLEPYLGVEEA